MDDVFTSEQLYGMEQTELYDLECAHGHSMTCAWKRADYHCRAYGCTSRHADPYCPSKEHEDEEKPEDRYAEPLGPRRCRHRVSDMLRRRLVAA